MTDPFEDRLRGQLVAGRPRLVRRRRNRLAALAATATMVVVGVTAVAVLNRSQEPVAVISVASPSPGVEGEATGPTQTTTDSEAPAPFSGNTLVRFSFAAGETLESSVEAGTTAFAATVDRVKGYPLDSSSSVRDGRTPDRFDGQVAWVTVTASYRGGLRAGSSIAVRYENRSGPNPGGGRAPDVEVGQSYIFLVGATGTDSRIPGVDPLYIPVGLNGVGVISEVATSEPQGTTSLQIPLVSLIAMIDQAPAKASLKFLANRLGDEFVSLVSAGKLDSAADYLTEYALSVDEAPTALEAVKRFRTDNPWLQSAASLETSTTLPFAFSDSNPVVTVVGKSETGRVLGVTAVVMTRPLFVGSDSIVRLDQSRSDVQPASGSTVKPGDVVTISEFPIEGGVTAHIDGVEVPAEVDNAAGETMLTIPAWVSGDLVLTLSFATPEEPSAMAVWFTVGI